MQLKSIAPKKHHRLFAKASDDVATATLNAYEKSIGENRDELEINPSEMNYRIEPLIDVIVSILYATNSKVEFFTEATEDFIEDLKFNFEVAKKELY